MCFCFFVVMGNFWSSAILWNCEGGSDAPNHPLMIEVHIAA